MNKHDLEQHDYFRMLPRALKNDDDARCLAMAILHQILKIHEEICKNIIYPVIDSLDEPLLDILAYEMHVDWYDYEADLSVKRNLIKSSVRVHKYLGTVYAVEQVVRDYFGKGDISEWFDYDGQRGTFSVLTKMCITEDSLLKFLKVLKKVKNTRSHLEKLTILNELQQTLYFGSVLRQRKKFGVRTVRKEKRARSNVYSGSFLRQRNKFNIGTVHENMRVLSCVYSGSFLRQRNKFYICGKEENDG